LTRGWSQGVLTQQVMMPQHSSPHPPRLSATRGVHQQQAGLQGSGRPRWPAAAALQMQGGPRVVLCSWIHRWGVLCGSGERALGVLSVDTVLLVAAKLQGVVTVIDTHLPARVAVTGATSLALQGHTQSVLDKVSSAHTPQEVCVL
jgi:hypothetical protein